MRKPPVMISACLAGIRCRYDGQHARNHHLPGLVETYTIIPFCPEQLGGLPTPRPPAGISGGDGRKVLSRTARLINAEGRDVTEAFRRGAQEALRLAHLLGITLAIMKDKSPSCGLRTPYCDNPAGFGIGVTAALFESNGIKLFEMGSHDPFPTRDFLQFIRTDSQIVDWSNR